MRILDTELLCLAVAQGTSLPNVVLEVAGTTSNQTVQLQTGWNYAGVSGFTDRTVPDDFSQIEGTCESIGDGAAEYHFGEGDGGLTNTPPRKVFWIEMNRPDVWK